MKDPHLRLNKRDITPLIMAAEGHWRRALAHIQLCSRANPAHRIGRIGKPEDIGAMVVLLLSDRSSFMLGSNVFIDGGYAQH